MESLREFLSVLRRRWRIVFWCCTLTLSAAVVAAFGSEAIYRSSGTIMIEKADIDPELARSTVVGVVEQQLDLVRRRVMRSDNLQDLIAELDLYSDLEPNGRAPQLRASMTLEQVDPITLEPKVGAPAFTIHFDYPDPGLAHDVAEALIDLFIADNRTVRMESATETERFFDAESETLRTELAAAGDRLADFKLQNQGLLPEDIDRNQQILERLRQNRLDVQSSLRLATERRNLLTVQLDELAGGTELAKLRAELAVAQQKYSADHPDIKRLTRAIDALEASGENANTMNADYMLVSAQLTAVQNEIDAHESRDREMQQRVDELEGRLVSAPEVEKEIQRLTREYELANTEYESIRQKRSEARIGSNLELQDKSERYTIIREPSVPLAPISPNRLGILFIAILLSIGGSTSLAALRESTDGTVRSTRDVIAVFGGPPLANVPMIRNATDRRLFWRKLGMHGLGSLVVISIALGLILNG